MNSAQLILYTRVGCCLCEGVEEKLNAIALDEINPSLELYVKDIDGRDVTSLERARYSFEVPVLTLVLKEKGQTFELPRVPLRLKPQAFLNWLHKHIQERIEEG